MGLGVGLWEPGRDGVLSTVTVSRQLPSRVRLTNVFVVAVSTRTITVSPARGRHSGMVSPMKSRKKPWTYVPAVSNRRRVWFTMSGRASLPGDRAKRARVPPPLSSPGPCPFRPIRRTKVPSGEKTRTSAATSSRTARLPSGRRSASVTPPNSPAPEESVSETVRRYSTSYLGPAYASTDGCPTISMPALSRRIPVNTSAPGSAEQPIRVAAAKARAAKGVPDRPASVFILRLPLSSRLDGGAPPQL